ncbi:mercuric ion transport protein [Litoreibacter ponti]|uniref:Mercuric ion transport protein n=1 Tax=Litoreibacter ponti TaxID=1510457 RepID=A0A2T6BFY6_9RHOB|nr:mercury resistance system transport protein MerF [Litoreibacter ponti]PTX54969.1 mercuric ion transport protein [Litoreibacter ponti]
MLKDRGFRIGLIGSVVAAICCFTPLLVITLTSLGLGAYTIWIDPIVVPALIVFGGILVASAIRVAQARA